MRYRILRDTLAAACALALCRCGDISVASGGGGGIETVALNGKAAYPDGRPAAGARVRLRPADYLAQDSARGLPPDRVAGADGAFAWAGLDTGRYRLEINDGAGMAVALGLEARRDSALGTRTLKPVGAVAGKVAPEAGYRRVRIYGLERSAAVDAAGRFRFADLPEGDYTLRFTGDAGARPPANVADVIAISGDSTLSPPPGWGHIRRITVNTAPAGVSPLDDIAAAFPLALRLTGAEIDFAGCRPDGGDLRFYNARGDSLPYEIEAFDPAAGSALVWMLADTILPKTADQRFYLAYGNPAAAPGGSARAVFDSARGFAGVWHLSEAGGAGTRFQDATGDGGAGSDSGRATAGPGVLAGGQGFAGAGTFIAPGQVPAWALSGPFTLSAWIRMGPPGAGGPRPVISEIRSASDTLGFRLLVDPDSLAPARGRPAVLFVRGRDTLRTGATAWDRNWHFVAIRWMDGKAFLRFDGTEEGSLVMPALAADPLAPLVLGGGNPAFDGSLDEVRLEWRDRGDDWLRLSYLTQRPGQGIVTFK